MYNMSLNIVPVYSYKSHMGLKLYLYYDETQNSLSNIALRLREFQRAKQKGTPNGNGLYLTIYAKPRYSSYS